MTQRKRKWFVGLVFALLAACVLVWKGTEHPRFRFLEGSKRTWFHIQYGQGRACAVEDFELDLPVSIVRKHAEAELRPLGFLCEDLPSDAAGSVDYTRPWPRAPEYAQHVTLYAEGSRTRIGTTRAPTVADHVAWFFIQLLPRKPLSGRP